LQKVHTFAGVNTCDSVVTFTLTVNDTAAVTTGDVTCASALPYEWKHGAEVVYTFTKEDWQAGDLTRVHTFAGVNTCDSVVTFTLTVMDTIAVNDGATVCSNHLPYNWMNKTEVVYTFTTEDWQKGELTKVHTFQASSGCDSTVTFTLTVLDTIAVSDGDIVCSNKLPYEWKNGAEVVYTFTTEDWQKGELQKVHTFAGVNTCDSVVTFTLTVNDTVATNDGATICSNKLPYEWKNGAEVVYTFTTEDWQKGELQKVHTFAGVNTCDSVVTFTLTVNDTAAVTTGDVTCASALPYEWKHGAEVVYTFTKEDWQAGDLTRVHTFAGVNTCDSVVTFTLVVNDTVAVTDGDVTCSNHLPYEWKNGSEVVATFTKADYEAGRLTKVHTFQTSSGCDSTVTFTLVVNAVTSGEEWASEEDKNLPYMWNGIACTETKDYTVTLTNAAECDSIATLHFTVIITKCTSLKATLEIDTICGNDTYMQGVLTVTEGEAVSYSVTYGKKDPHGHLQDLQDVPFSGGKMQIPFAPVADTTKYIRPDAYPVTISVLDSCEEELKFDVTLYVLYPSWILKQRWNDVIALYNDKFNGGYKFSSIRWFHEGKLIPGQGTKNSYIYVYGDNSKTLDFGTDYWAGLVREGETEEICTCHLRPEYTSNYQTRFAPLVQISARNRGRDLTLTTEESGDYRMYDVCGRYLGGGQFGEAYQTYKIELPNQYAAGTYILVFQTDAGERETHKIAIE